MTDTTTMDRMRLIRAHLEATSRGRSPSPEQVGIWLRELEEIPAEDLDNAIRAARRHHAEATDRGKRWGRLTPDDVLMLYTSGRIKDDGPPESPDCPHGCSAGLVSVLDSGQLAYTVRCTCPSGEWYLRHPVFGKGSTVEGALGRGWVLARPVSTIPPAHREWLEARTSCVGAETAMREYRKRLLP